MEWRLREAHGELVDTIQRGMELSEARKHERRQPRAGKRTTLLQAMFLNDLDRDASIIVIDSKGDLLDPLKAWPGSKTACC